MPRDSTQIQQTITDAPDDLKCFKKFQIKKSNPYLTLFSYVLVAVLYMYSKTAIKQKKGSYVLLSGMDGHPFFCQSPFRQVGQEKNEITYVPAADDSPLLRDR